MATKGQKGYLDMAYLWQGVLVLFVLEMLTFAFFITKIGFVVVFLLWVLSAITGGYMVRHGGLSTLMGMLATNQSTQKPAIEGFLILIAGLLFIFPGFISDIFALLILMPFAQSLLKLLSERFQTHPQQATKGHTQDDAVIEGDFEVIDEDAKSLPRKNEVN